MILIFHSFEGSRNDQMTHDTYHTSQFETITDNLWCLSRTGQHKCYKFYQAKIFICSLQKVFRLTIWLLLGMRNFVLTKDAVPSEVNVLILLAPNKSIGILTIYGKILGYTNIIFCCFILTLLCEVNLMKLYRTNQ